MGWADRYSSGWRIHLSPDVTGRRAGGDRRRGGGEDGASICAGVRVARQRDAIRQGIAGVEGGTTRAALGGAAYGQPGLATVVVGGAIATADGGTANGVQPCARGQRGAGDGVASSSSHLQGPEAQ